ncbi:MAG: FAD-dependent oxidoreductase [Ardenticatenales bacterium]|nr:FAD-dependent oxidoreductase [Ardenticatenales bacterium]
MHDLLVVGGGPGGVAAAAYGLHLGLDTLIISPDLGGKVNYHFELEGLPAIDTVHGSKLTQIFAAKIDLSSHLAQSVSAVEEIPGGFRVTPEQGEPQEGKTLVIATGAKPRRLYVPGEDKYWGRGLSYSALSHAPLFVGREVAVIGNDRRAQIAALELSRVASTVYFIVPRPQMLDPLLMERLTARGNTQLFQRWEVISVDGKEFVTGLSLQSGDGVIRELKLDGVFVELGLLANSDLVAHLVERDEQGRIKINHQACTSHPAIFAAGDVTDVHGEQVPIALGDGIKAALSASEYLVGQPEN